MILGIDASNIGSGGTKNHLFHLLQQYEVGSYGIQKIIVWGGQRVFSMLPPRAGVEYVHIPMLDKSLPFRSWWQAVHLTPLARRSCDVLFAPGSIYIGNFRPFVSLYQNVLPFVWEEMRRYPLFSTAFLRLLLLRWSQIHTFRQADGMIFLSDYAREVITEQSGRGCGQMKVIPYGIEDKFRLKPRPQKLISDQPFKLLYVSTIDAYKHQWLVVEAVAQLRNQGFPLQLDLIGGGFSHGMRLLEAAQRQFDPEGQWVKYHAEIPPQDISRWYHQADAFVFASTCEAISMAVLEAMAAGLPTACTKRRPMTDVLGDAGFYFEPESVPSMVETIGRMLADPHLREQAAWRAYERASEYSWQRCARETFSFIQHIATS